MENIELVKFLVLSLRFLTSVWEASIACVCCGGRKGDLIFFNGCSAIFFGDVFDGDDMSKVDITLQRGSSDKIDWFFLLVGVYLGSIGVVKFLLWALDFSLREFLGSSITCMCCG